MKTGSNFLALCLILLTVLCQAQISPYFNYQGVARDANDEIITGSIDVTLEVLNQVNQSVFQKDATITTNPQGVFSCPVGPFPPSINWSAGSYSLRVSLARAGESKQVFAATPLHSVPFAMHAATANTSLLDNDTSSTNEIQHLRFNPGTNKIGLTQSNDSVDLSQLLNGKDWVWENINDSAYFFGKGAFIYDSISQAGISMTPDNISFIRSDPNNTWMIYSHNNIVQSIDNGFIGRGLYIGIDTIALTGFAGFAYGNAYLDRNGLTISNGFSPNDFYTKYSMGGIQSTESVLFVETSLDIRDDILINGITAGKGPGGHFGNTVFGENSFQNSNDNTINNTSIGQLVLRNLETGNSNTAIGRTALQALVNGYENSALGEASLHLIEEGGYNTSAGSFSLLNLIAGYHNTSIGSNSLAQTLFSSGNVAVGSFAGNSFGPESNSHLGYNTYIGYESGNAVGGALIAGSTALGAWSRVTESNQVRIGSNNTSSIGGFQNWSNFSDGRFKINVKEDVPGLEFVLKLRPVSYNLDIPSIENRLGIKSTYLGSTTNSQGNPMNVETTSSGTMTRTGFIAQEVEAVATDLGFSFSGVDVPTNEASHYGLRYAEFVVPLVKAVQEQQKEIEELKQQVEQLKALIQSLPRHD